MPRAAHETLRGIISREAERIATVLHDPEKTAVNLVTTPDELPVSETQEAYQQLTEELRLPMGALFINRMHTAPFPAAILQTTTIQGTSSAVERQWIELLLRCGHREAMRPTSKPRGFSHFSTCQFPSFRFRSWGRKPRMKHSLSNSR
jgi:anion-transporting  ArsA/GET3 family ATPase